MKLDSVWLREAETLLEPSKHCKLSEQVPDACPNVAPSPYLLNLVIQDTITGFLLAGVGNVDLRRKTNYLVVDSSEQSLSGA